MGSLNWTTMRLLAVMVAPLGGTVPTTVGGVVSPPPPPPPQEDRKRTRGTNKIKNLYDFLPEIF
jgi:hypothetical protein